MPAVTLDVADLAPFTADLDPAKAVALMMGVVARTAVFAPTILSEDFAYSDAARDLILVAVLRRVASDGGAVSTETIGPYSVTVDSSALARGGLYTEDEMDEWARISRLSTVADTGALVPVFAFPDAPAGWPDPPVWF